MSDMYDGPTESGTVAADLRVGDRIIRWSTDSGVHEPNAPVIVTDLRPEAGWVRVYPPPSEGGRRNYYYKWSQEWSVTVALPRPAPDDPTDETRDEILWAIGHSTPAEVSSVPPSKEIGLRHVRFYADEDRQAGRHAQAARLLLHRAIRGASGAGASWGELAEASGLTNGGAIADILEGTAADPEYDHEPLPTWIADLLELMYNLDDSDSLWPIPAGAGRFRWVLGVNDVFSWGTADCETVGRSDVAKLRQAHADLVAVTPYSGGMWTVELWAARRRGERPQGAFYKQMPPEVAALFDAAGPPRETGLGNPSENTPAQAASVPQTWPCEHAGCPILTPRRHGDRVFCYEHCPDPACEMCHDPDDEGDLLA